MNVDPNQNHNYSDDIEATDNEKLTYSPKWNDIPFAVIFIAAVITFIGFTIYFGRMPPVDVNKTIHIAYQINLAMLIVLLSFILKIFVIILIRFFAKALI